MDKLYWIVCEEGDTTLFEGRYQGRTRGAAMKHLKEQVGRPTLNGLVYTITEIPVPLIRQIVAEILGQEPAVAVTEIRPVQPERPVERFDAFAPADTVEDAQEAPVEANPFQDTQPRPAYDWEAIKACYMEGRSPKEVARIMNVPPNTLKTRITREGWAKERRGE